MWINDFPDIRLKTVKCVFCGKVIILTNEANTYIEITRKDIVGIDGTGVAVNLVMCHEHITYTMFQGSNIAEYLRLFEEGAMVNAETLILKL